MYFNESLMKRLFMFVPLVLATLSGRVTSASLTSQELTDGKVAITKKIRAPLPLDVVADTRYLQALELSPDGQWLAHLSLTAAEPVEGIAGLSHSPTGAPVEGKYEVILTEEESGYTVSLSHGKSSSWAPRWSPDSQRLAYYSDTGGEAGIWIWDRNTSQARRFPGVIPWVFHDAPYWTSDGKKIICQILPEGLNIAAANTTERLYRGRAFDSKISSDEPRVIVERSGRDTNSPVSAGFLHPANSDLAILDVHNLSIRRVVRKQHFDYSSIAPSPDGRYLAYLELKEHNFDTLKLIYDLRIIDLSNGAARTLAQNLPMQSTDLHWSPNSKKIAYLEGGSELRPARNIAVQSITGTARYIKSDEFLYIDNAPRIVWGPDGNSLYVISKGMIWRFESGTYRAEKLDIPGYTDIYLMRAPRASKSSKNNAVMWVLANDQHYKERVLLGIDLNTKKSHVLARTEGKERFQMISDAGDKIAYTVKNREDPGSAWLLNTHTLSRRQVTDLNAPIARYELGDTRRIEYYGVGGRKLRSTLLLPPGYKPGHLLPMVVWVYYGASAPDSPDWAFMRASVFNLHVLATRGYAVLWANMLGKEGVGWMQSAISTAIPAVNAAIDAGYADADRLALMGHSAGSVTVLALLAQTSRFKAAIFSGNTQHPEIFIRYVTAGPERTAWMAAGNPWDNRERFIENSPFFFFDRISTPILIGQGDLELGAAIPDQRTYPIDFIFTSLKRLKKEVEYRVYQNEGHVIWHRPNVIDFWNSRLEFLAKHLDLRVSRDGSVAPD